MAEDTLSTSNTMIDLCLGPMLFSTLGTNRAQTTDHTRQHQRFENLALTLLTVDAPVRVIAQALRKTGPTERHKEKIHMS